MGRRSGSPGHWRQRQVSDPYVARATREGWRSRAVFKLQQIQARSKLLKPGVNCVDLGASPGGWSQYAAGIVHPIGRIWALDREPLEPIPGVTFIQGDFADPQILSLLRSALGDSRIDLVMSDMSPNLSGNRVVDQVKAMELADGVLEFARGVLDEGGGLLIKLFQGEGFDDFIASVRSGVGSVRVIKPPASRSESREVYLLARTYGM